MRVETTKFGTLEVGEESVIFLPEGLVGFEGLKRFVLLEREGEEPFKWLQSLDEPSIAFVVIDPMTFKRDYLVPLEQEEAARLGIERPDDAALLVIVTIPKEREGMTANLQGPLVVNLKSKLGKQLVLTEELYTTKHNILEELRASSHIRGGGNIFPPESRLRGL